MVVDAVVNVCDDASKVEGDWLCLCVFNEQNWNDKQKHYDE